jgi:predicted secreted protein
MRLAVAAAMVLVAGCSTVWDPHAPKTVTAHEEGGAVTVRHGDRLHVPLTSDAGSGYEWRLVEPPMRMVVAEGPPDQEGLYFTPVRDGEEQLRLEYRPVSGEGPAQRSVSYDVTVPPETWMVGRIRSALFGRRRGE